MGPECRVCFATFSILNGFVRRIFVLIQRVSTHPLVNNRINKKDEISESLSHAVRQKRVDSCLLEITELQLIDIYQSSFALIHFPDKKTFRPTLRLQNNIGSHRSFRI